MTYKQKIDEAAYNSERDRNSGNAQDDRQDAFKCGTAFGIKLVIEMLNCDGAMFSGMDILEGKAWANYITEELKKGGVRVE